ncbi:glycerophosphodiester phosphodiesterase [Halalkalicoccus salilacus]|uniref:glycerophosphodiester phosphodiesterase n=1 Tax=Halalkalicoccus salilacus TaxID=3117459 RepID=UPI00300E938D
MYVTAHRGFGDRYPENTVEAVTQASEDADAVEIDVRRCGSGELVVTHYDHLALVTDGHGDVNELSAAEVTSFTIEGSSECIPRLDAVLDAIPPHTDINIELKELHLAADVLDAIDDLENDVVISALDANVHTLWETRRLDDSVPLALNFSLRPQEDLEIADLIGCTYANTHWALCLCTDVIDRAHDCGMEVHAWPVGSRVIAEALRWRGVDGLIARSPHVVP